MKECIRCFISKEFSEFRKLNRAKDGFNPVCKSCISLKEKTSYKERTDEQKIKKRDQAKLRYANQSKFIYEYLLTHSCVDCGEDDPIVLEFDHRNNKMFTISEGLGSYSLEKLQTEINKCDIRCANCHRRKTAIQLGWHKYNREFE